ncbi:MAG: hypothetical protein CSYNP_03661 [Syntrophus sp. SKADARSKE-3]|nr:hypothetical protein [Syntrophus sp. SKADARSKE-3]
MQKLLQDETEKLMQELGLTEEDLASLDRVTFPKLFLLDRRRIATVSPTASLDKMAPIAIARLKALVTPEWLKSEAKKKYRLTKDFLSSPFQLVGSIRIDNTADPPAQRLARMILLCEDWIKDAEDLDFHAASLLVPEAIMLGMSIDKIPKLGPEAVRKLGRLSMMRDDDHVAAAVHELLVGTACVSMGTDVEMIKSNSTEKSPDFRVLGKGPPTVIECKRRIGLSDYEQKEAMSIGRLYDSVREELRSRRHSISLEVEFDVEVRCVRVTDFRRAALKCAKTIPWKDGFQKETWGKIKCVGLPYYTDLRKTRLYAPIFMEKVFQWHSELSEWDGIIAEVDSPSQFIVSNAKQPICLKWRCRNDIAILKKSRGVTSLWAKAVKQIPPGEMGIIYISYPEQNAPEIADERTLSIFKSMKEWRHDWWVSVPLVIIGRLYPRPRGVGNPDLIENAIVLVETDLEDVLPDKYPGPVFVPAPRYEDE